MVGAIALAKRTIDNTAGQEFLEGAKVTRTFCFMCPWHCITEAYVKGGKLVFVKGADEAHNEGLLCPRGEAAPQEIYDSDRLKYPLKRVGARGEGKFKRISWDEAFTEIASKLKEIKEKYGPEAVLVENGRNPQGYFLGPFFKDLYGTPNIYGHTAICEQARRFAALQMFGHVYPMWDFANSKYIMFFGLDLIGHPQGLYPNIGLHRAIGRGAKLVVVDPRRSPSAELAHEWIPIKPGADGALALAMCKVIIDEGLYDKEFVRKWVVGFEEFKNHLKKKGYTPEWASEITGVSADTIKRLAREFATTKPAVAESFKGLSNYANGAQAARAVYSLLALTGNVDGPGNLILIEWAAVGAPVGIPEEAKTEIKKPPLSAAMGYPMAPDLPSSLVPKAILEEKPYPIKGLFFFHRNAAQTEADENLYREALKKAEFIVDIDIYKSETAMFADIVLPDCTMFERADLKANLTLGPEAVLAQPVIEPLYESKSWSEIIKGIAEKMGWGQYFKWNSWEDWAKNMSKSLPVKLEELKAKGYWDGPLRYRKYSEKDVGFGTPTTKIAIYSEVMKENGYDPLPTYTEPVVKPDKEYPLRMIQCKSAVHKQSKTQNLLHLMALEGENWAEINPAEAKKYSIVDGDRMLIESPLDSAVIKAKVTEDIIPGVICVVHGHGFGHIGLGRNAIGKGTYINTLIGTYPDPISGSTTLNECKVRVRKAYADILPIERPRGVLVTPP